MIILEKQISKHCNNFSIDSQPTKKMISLFQEKVMLGCIYHILQTKFINTINKPMIKSILKVYLLVTVHKLWIGIC